MVGTGVSTVYSSGHCWQGAEHAGSKGVCHPGLPQAPRQPGSTSPSQRRVTVRQQGTARYNNPGGVHVRLPQATRKKTRDHLLYGTNQLQFLCYWVQPGVLGWVTMNGMTTSSSFKLDTLRERRPVTHVGEAGVNLDISRKLRPIPTQYIHTKPVLSILL